jgi:ABC-type uncharacterized transport system involved in gliding motility auxiliary subunit/ABC-type transport system involved in multi-copper enzyme maturation permease subunit
MNANVLYAVFKRNFVSYFASPMGYLFICVFVWLSVLAAFWPNDFFNANLANLDQLNKFFPLIMLVFVPAITMSIWADERRQGTDELLLTIPAADLDIVLGKYLAAVAIYTVSLLFSLVCNFAVLRMLGNPDEGLFLGTYVGYWLVGLAMLATGMVASFLTPNLTVAYILGAIFNAPLVFANSEVMTVAVRALISVPAKLVAWSDSLLTAIGAPWERLAVLRQQWEEAALSVPPRLAQQIESWGIGGQFHDFGRGVVSLSGIVYFLLIVAVMLYLSIVLIGRRHWRAGRLGTSAAVFYPLWHVACAVVFVLLWFVLRDHVSQFTLLLELIGLYLLVQAGFILLCSIARPRVALLPGHYITRTLALAAVAVGVVVFFQRFDIRIDVTSERLNSLTPETVALLEELKPERPVQIEAFISPQSEMPESYIPTRLTLLNRLQELRAYGGENVVLRINDTERFSEEASRADQRFGIQSREVRTTDRGTLKTDNIYLGVAFTCGLEKVILPFVDRGIPIEYELARSIATVTQQKRKRLAVLDTDAALYGNFMNGAPQWPIVDELEKQYKVKRVTPADLITDDEECEKEGMRVLDVDPANEEQVVRKGMELLGITGHEKTGPAKFSDKPERKAVLNAGTKSEVTLAAKEIDKCKARVREEARKLGKFDVLLAVQPSTLGPEDMDRFIATVRYGQPTAIFEDPCPAFASWVAATSQPRTPPSNPMMMMAPRQMPKGDLTRLWDTLGISLLASRPEGAADMIVWQNYNPYPKLDFFREQKAFVFIGKGSRAEEPFNEESPITSKLQNALFPFPGAISHLNLKRRNSDLEYTDLIRTGKKTGTIEFSELMQMGPMGRSRINPNPPLHRTNESYVLATQIRGKLKPDLPMADEGGMPPGLGFPPGMGMPPGGPGQAAPKKLTPITRPTDIKVVVVADIDMLTPTFFALREQGAIEELGISFDFDNVTFVLNALDELAGDDRFIDIRKHRSVHRTLTRIEQATEAARDDTAKTRDRLNKEVETTEKTEREALEGKIEELKKREGLRAQEAIIELALAQQDGERRLSAKIEEVKLKRDREIKRIETKLARQVRQVQDGYKMWAVLLPPIPPLLVALGVFLVRRSREREGVSRSRLKP